MSNKIYLSILAVGWLCFVLPLVLEPDSLFYLHKKGLMLERSGDLDLWASLPDLQTPKSASWASFKKLRVHFQPQMYDGKEPYIWLRLTKGISW